MVQIIGVVYAFVREEQEEEKQANHEREHIDHASDIWMGCSGLWSVYRHFSRWADFA